MSTSQGPSAALACQINAKRRHWLNEFHGPGKYANGLAWSAWYTCEAMKTVLPNELVVNLLHLVRMLYFVKFCHQYFQWHQEKIAKEKVKVLVRLFCLFFVVWLCPVASSSTALREKLMKALL